MKTLILSLALCAMMIGAPVAAQPGMGGMRGGPDGEGGPGRHGMMNKREIREKLKLTDEQVKAIRDIRTQHQKAMVDVRSAIAKKRIDLKSVMEADAPNRADVEKLTREIGDLMISQRMAAFDLEQAIMKQLTPEQKKMWKEMRPEIMQGMRERMMERREGRGR